MPDPIRFDVSNPQTPDAGPIIYISNDAATWGRLDVTLTNQSEDNSDIKLKPGGVLKVYLEMLSPDDLKAIALASDSAWTGGLDPTGRHLELHPKNEISIASQNSTTVELQDVLGQAPRQGKFRFFYASLGISNAVVQGFVQRPPDDSAAPWDLTYGLAPRDDYQGQGGTIYVTAPGKPEISNYLLIQFYRMSGGTLPFAGTPRLSISFIAGESDLALCSDDQLKHVAASIWQQRPEGRWKAPTKDTQGEDTIWTIEPADGHGDLFSEDGVLELRFDNIVTNLPSGPNAIMFIQYSGLTGYDDGYIPVLLNKSDPAPYIRYFRAKANETIIANKATIDFAPLSLEWDVFAADGCVLKADNETDSAPVASSGSEPIVARQSQSYTLQPVTGSNTVPGKDVEFYVAPPTATLTSTHSDDMTHRVLHWECQAIGSDSHCLLLDGGFKAHADVPLTTPVPGTSLMTTGPQTSRINGVYYTLLREGGAEGSGGIKTRVDIGPAAPILQWECGSGSHCVLYANDVKVGDVLPLSSSQQGEFGITYRIECVGVGSASATTSPTAPSKTLAVLEVAYGQQQVVTWSLNSSVSNYVFSDSALYMPRSPSLQGVWTDIYNGMGPANTGWPRIAYTIQVWAPPIGFWIQIGVR